MNRTPDCGVSNKTDPKDWCFRTFNMNYIEVCYEASLTHDNTIWRAENSAKYAIPTFLFQLILIILITRPLMAAFKCMRLPRITAEILGGMILGSSGVPYMNFLGRRFIFPYKSLWTLETLANLGLLFYVFLMGLEVDVTPIVRAPKKAFSIALAGILVAFPIGYGLNYVMVRSMNPNSLYTYPTLFGPLFCGIVLCNSNYFELVQILSDLKLLRSEVGRTSISAAMISDCISWVLLILSMGVFNNGKVFTPVLAAAFVLAMLFVIKPALAWAVTRIGQSIEARGGYSDYHLSIILTLVIVCGYITDICGCHSFLGGFMLGIIMPKGDLKEKLMEKVGTYVPGFMMPAFFCLIGLRTTFNFLFDQFSALAIVTVLLVAFAIKILTTILVSVFVNKDGVKDSLALGVLMNTKGMISLIILTTARNFRVFDNQTFTVLIMALWIMTIAVGPILSLIYRSNKPYYGYGNGIQQTIASLEPDSEFRVLTCFHTVRELSGIINLLRISNPTRASPINVSAVHLVENLGRTSAVRIVINSDSNDDFSGHFAALKFNKEPGTVVVETLTVVSEYTTMDVDVCTLAREHSANLVILPFNLKSSGGGGDDALTTVENSSAVANSTHNPFRSVNKNVMDRVGCSVAVLVDRGTRHPSKEGYRRHSHVLMIFLGGPDDREGLKYAGRMSDTPGLTLNVVRFVGQEEAPMEGVDGAEQMLDDQCVEEICIKTKENKNVEVTTTVITEGDEIVKSVMAMDGGHYDLVAVGRGRSGRGSSLIAPQSDEWTEFPELGSLGDSLVCSNFAENACILVVQQGDG